MRSSVENVLGSDHRELDGFLVQAFSAIGDGDLALTFRKLDLFWARLAMHIRAEHLHLFPALLALPLRADEDRESLARVLDDLRDDHNYFMGELANSIKLLRTLTAAPRPDAASELGLIEKTLTDLRERLAAHNELEEDRIYAIAGRVPKPVDGHGLEELINKELENMPHRFRDVAGPEHSS